MKWNRFLMFVTLSFSALVFMLNVTIGFTGARSPLRSRAGGFPISVFFIRQNVGKYNVGWEKNNILMMTGASAVPPVSSAEVYDAKDVAQMKIYRNEDHHPERRIQNEYKSKKYTRVGDVPDPKIWASLKSANGSSVNLSAIPKDKPILVVADPRSSDCNPDVKTILKSFAAKCIHMTVTWMVVTPDKSSSNQRLAKKTRAKGEILSDENLIWLDAHLVTIQDPWSWVVFVIDPTHDYRIADVWLPKDILAEDIAARVQISLKSKKIQKGAEAPPMVLALYFLLYVSTFYVLSVRVLGF